MNKRSITTKEWIITLSDNQGNELSRIEDIQAKTENEAIKKAKKEYFTDISWECNILCPNCNKENSSESTECESCGKPL